ncbi:glycosyltransferase [Trujillonella endophytica]|uniref:Glycosyltransferase, catalytic subunit of cellulose synthase and poly-beta-1,6-N-acetylglucosamine synthase n=1 Tax=Trujillonella endophytica TaxID=673521 RepID=A0A1H8PMA4_9ACTN|nr:glycosyltransferase family 2 protein [Trujillella endophytica]SEO43149.1 Glycosyltransferase, catalytic subunit of cellulose synthase and poly-beta-1,6-N-acetylglucosamine synthase [Trujillella endophytica]
MTELVVHGMRRATDRVTLLARGDSNVPDISSLVPAEFGGSAADEQRRTATISCIIPAYNEESTIADVLTSLLAQTRPPDAIHVIINNTDDDTPEIAQQFAGEHFRVVKGEAYHTVVHIHDIGENPDKKVGALNFGYFVSRGYDYILGVDGDTTLDRHCVEWLEKEMVTDPRIGGLSAIYTFDKTKVKGAMAKFLVAGQRAQFAGFNMDNLVRGRNMAVLGGQCSLFSVRALEMVMYRNHQTAPWVRDSEVEDSKLSLQIKDAGFNTKISARARAFVGPMTTLRALHGQQVKWNFGGIDLLWPGQRGDTKGQPLHPNLRLRWYENISMVFNIGTRMSFLLLLAAAMSIDAFVFNPIWLIPPAVATLLNLRIALAMHDKSASDLLYAFLFAPAEFYMWIRMGHFVSAWVQFLSRSEKDNWAAQAAAEKGRGSAYVMPAVCAVVTFCVLIYAWGQQSVDVQSAILSIGWPVLYLVTVLQTVFMIKKLLRRQKGFSV